MFSKKSTEEEHINDDDVLGILRLAGASFAIVFICTVIGPLTGFMTLEYGAFLTSIFSVSTLIAFPIEALYSKLKQKLWSIQYNLVIVLALSLVMFIVLERGSEIFMVKFVGFIFGIPLIAGILLMYLFLHTFIPKILHLKMEGYEKQIRFLVYIAIPTIIFFSILFFTLSVLGITIGFEEIGGFVNVAAE